MGRTTLPVCVCLKTLARYRLRPVMHPVILATDRMKFLKNFYRKKRHKHSYSKHYQKGFQRSYLEAHLITRTVVSDHSSYMLIPK